MAVRNANALVDADDIKDIIDTNLTDEQINAFINMAYFVSKDLGDTSEVSQGMLTEIQRLLAAHFITCREQQPKSEKLRDVSATYRGADGMGLRSSTYGQQAIALDASGILGTRAEGLRRATIKVWRQHDLAYDVDDD